MWVYYSASDVRVKMVEHTADATASTTINPSALPPSLPPSLPPLSPSLHILHFLLSPRPSTFCDAECDVDLQHRLHPCGIIRDAERHRHLLGEMRLHRLRWACSGYEGRICRRLKRGARRRRRSRRGRRHGRWRQRWDSRRTSGQVFRRRHCWRCRRVRDRNIPVRR